MGVGRPVPRRVAAICSLWVLAVREYGCAPKATSWPRRGFGLGLPTSPLGGQGSFHLGVFRSPPSEGRSALLPPSEVAQPSLYGWLGPCPLRAAVSCGVYVSLVSVMGVRDYERETGFEPATFSLEG